MKTELKVTGVIERINEVEVFQSKDGANEYMKLIFVLKTNEEKNNLYAFEVFGTEKVENFLKYQKVNAFVDVKFNVKTNEWNGKFFTTLSCWNIFKSDVKVESEVVVNKEAEETFLPF
jgi:hypothetical protein